MKRIWGIIALVSYMYACNAVVIEIDESAEYEERKSEFILLGTIQLGRSGIPVAKVQEKFRMGCSLLARLEADENVVTWYSLSELTDITALNCMAANSQEDVQVSWFVLKKG